MNGKDEQWQADLVDVQSLKESNDDYKYILTVIDVLSKYAWAVPLKDSEVKPWWMRLVPFLEKIANPSACRRMQVQNLLTKVSRLSQIQGHRAFCDLQRSQSPNCRTIQPNPERADVAVFDHANSLRYLDVLADLVKSYNNSFHRSIRMPPRLGH